MITISLTNTDNDDEQIAEKKRKLAFWKNAVQSNFNISLFATPTEYFANNLEEETMPIASIPHLEKEENFDLSKSCCYLCGKPFIFEKEPEWRPSRFTLEHNSRAHGHCQNEYMFYEELYDTLFNVIKRAYRYKNNLQTIPIFVLPNRTIAVGTGLGVTYITAYYRYKTTSYSIKWEKAYPKFKLIPSTEMIVGYYMPPERSCASYYNPNRNAKAPNFSYAADVLHESEEYAMRNSRESIQQNMELGKAAYESCQSKQEVENMVCNLVREYLNLHAISTDKYPYEKRENLAKAEEVLRKAIYTCAYQYAYMYM